MNANQKKQKQDSFNTLSMMITQMMMKNSSRKKNTN